MKLCWKDVLAVLIGLVTLAGLAVMFVSEPGAATSIEDYKAEVLPKLKQYAGALGAILFAVSIAYILLGRDNDVETRADEK